MLVFYGVSVFNLSLSKAIELILKRLIAEVDTNDCTVKCISLTSSHGLVEAWKDESFKRILQNFFLNLPDGVPIVWWAHMRGCSTIRRCYGPELFIGLMKATKNLDVTHFFCGGKSGVAEELKYAVGLRWGIKNVTGVYTPPFRPMQELDWINLVTKINDSAAQIIWVGLSTPKQEKFAYELAKRVKVRFIITIGAAFDFHTGRLAQAPRWIQRSGLEWLFRLCTEPRRLWKRYLEIVPKFAILAGADLTKHYLQKRS